MRQSRPERGVGDAGAGVAEFGKSPTTNRKRPETTPDPNRKMPVCDVTEAIKLGADAISVHVNLGAETEPEMLAHLGQVSGECRDWGMPLLAMMYARGKKITNQYDVEFVKHAARVGAEMGADVVKVVYTGSRKSFEKVEIGTRN